MRDAVVGLPNGKILVAFGGERIEVYDPGSGIFVPVSGTVGAARYMGTATVLGDGRVLIAGGYIAPRIKNGIRLLTDGGCGSIRRRKSDAASRSVPPAVEAMNKMHPV
jgi:hypothetical protein